MPRPATLPEPARKNLRSEANQGALRTLVILFVALFIGAVVESASGIVALGLTIGGVLVAGAYGFGALRAARLVRNLPEEPERVQVVGWTRAPDGSNYGIWPRGTDSREHEPRLVLRLTSSRDTASGDALLLGPVAPRRTAALVGADGEILGVGGLRSPASAARVWARRDDPAPWWTLSAKRSRPDT